MKILTNTGSLQPRLGSTLQSDDELLVQWYISPSLLMKTCCSLDKNTTNQNRNPKSKVFLTNVTYNMISFTLSVFVIAL